MEHLRIRSVSIKMLILGCSGFLSILESYNGNGQERKDRLGILYDDVQARVNEIYKHLK